ncbi:MAG: TraB domain-containing protein [Methanomassiliicoccales archaeon]|nr:TraB domain-containing protein [Methanomassiliicoccales archaeon]
MIVLVGVGHVFNISDQVRGLIVKHMPRAVCIELDPGRYEALLNPGKERKVPVTYRLLAQFQKRMAREFGVEAGSEMVSAAKAAREIGADVLLIDADASALFLQLWREMSAKERMYLMFSAITGFFISRSRVEKELEKFEENEERYLQEIGEQFPTLKKVLIDDRNKIMATRIESASQRYDNVLAVVGDGHIEGISRLLAGSEVQVYRLRELIDGATQATSDDPGANAVADVHFSYSYEQAP